MQRVGPKKCGVVMTIYEQTRRSVHKKAYYLMEKHPPFFSKVISNSAIDTYLKPEYDTTKVLIEHMKPNSRVVVLASWLSLTRLEMFSMTDKVSDIVLLDHDKSVITIGETISKMYNNMNIKYIRKNVVFNDISEYVENRDVIIIPSINMLLPVDEVVPNIKSGTLLAVHGTSNMQMKYGNPIFNLDDLKSQVPYSEILFGQKYDSVWSQYNGVDYNFFTSVLVVRV